MIEKWEKPNPDKTGIANLGIEELKAMSST